MILRGAARTDRGGMILGFSALTVVLGVLCSIILLRSLESYQATATAVQRLQARAAAEGAAVLISAGGAGALAQPVQLGECLVRADTEASGTLPLLVEVHPNGSAKAALQLRYQLTLGNAGTTSTISRLELQL